MKKLSRDEFVEILANSDLFKEHKYPKLRMNIIYEIASRLKESEFQKFINNNIKSINEKRTSKTL